MSNNRKLLNETKGNLVATRILWAATFWRRLRGLMGCARVDFPIGTALVIVPCKQVHTFFMHFAIDVLFVDADFRVVEALPQLCPNRVSPYIKNARRVIELPPGTIAASGIAPQDKLAVYDCQYPSSTHAGLHPGMMMQLAECLLQKPTDKSTHRQCC